MISMPVVQDIRKLARSGCSVAEISRETGVSEPTVRKYVNMKDFSPKVPSKKQTPSILNAYKPVIDAWLEGDRRNWHKQRHTAKRIHERPVDEHGFEGSYSTVQRYVKDYKETHKDQRDEYLDLEWRPGEMQVDFGQADFRVVGVRKRLHDLVCDFPFSNVGLAQVFPGETAECVCEGLMAAFVERDAALVRELYHLACEEISGFRPKAAALLEEAEADALAYLDFPYAHHRRLRTNNVQERANREVKRRSRVVQVFPSRKSLIRLVGAVPSEMDEDWQGKRWFTVESIAEAYEEPGKRRPAPKPAYEGSAGEHAARIIGLVMSEGRAA